MKKIISMMLMVILLAAVSTQTLSAQGLSKTVTINNFNVTIGTTTATQVYSYLKNAGISYTEDDDFLFGKTISADNVTFEGYKCYRAIFYVESDGTIRTVEVYYKGNSQSDYYAFFTKMKKVLDGKFSQYYDKYALVPTDSERATYMEKVGKKYVKIFLTYYPKKGYSNFYLTTY